MQHPFIMGQKTEFVKMDADGALALPDAPQEPAPCPVCGSEGCTGEVCPLWAGRDWGAWQWRWYASPGRGSATGAGGA